MSEKNGGPGCLGAIMVIFMFFFLAPPLIAVAWDFWFYITCQQWGWQCDAKHILDWNIK